jgi:hypothetical protein
MMVLDVSVWVLLLAAFLAGAAAGWLLSRAVG